MTIASHVAFHEYEGVATNEAERERLASDLGNKPLMLLRNHGTLSVAPDDPLGLRAHLSSRMELHRPGPHARMARPLHAADPKAIAATGQMLDNPDLKKYADALAWPALLRRLDRLNPGYDA